MLLYSLQRADRVSCDLNMGVAGVCTYPQNSSTELNETTGRTLSIHPPAAGFGAPCKGQQARTGMVS